ncbi:MAG: PAS domain S-box protein, partial [Nitrosospira sp.]|nr:PAS domain S-box protein [Nitrosospira sp.]
TRTDLTALRADGTEFPAEVVVTRIPASDPALCTGYIRDVTEIRRNEQRRAMRYANSCGCEGPTRKLPRR